MYPKGILTYEHKGTPKMFIAALFVTEKSGNSPLVGNWIIELGIIHMYKITRVKMN